MESASGAQMGEQSAERRPDLGVAQRAPSRGAMKTGERWVVFGGSGESVGEVFRLRPLEDDSVIVQMRVEDVSYSGSTILVRLGARALSIAIPSGSQVYPVGPPPLPGECRGLGTRCVGHVKFCCHNNEVSGECPRPWRCP
jgi:hypothetical protein